MVAHCKACKANGLADDQTLATVLLLIPCLTVRHAELLGCSVVAHCKANGLADEQTLATVLLTLTLSTLSVGVAIVAVGEKRNGWFRWQMFPFAFFVAYWPGNI